MANSLRVPHAGHEVESITPPALTPSKVCWHLSVFSVALELLGSNLELV